MLVSASGFIRFSPHIRQAPPTRRFPGLLSNRILQLAASVSLIAASVAPPLALAHVGHGDEFQPQGEARQVQRNADSDALLGVTTARPQPGADGLSVPATAVVDAAGKPLLFVQTATTYDPVYVVTGGDQGDRVVVKIVSGEVTAKVLARRNSREVELLSLNPDHPPRVVPLGEIEWIARIVWASQ